MVGVFMGLARSWKDPVYSTSEVLMDMKKAAGKRQIMRRQPVRV